MQMRALFRAAIKTQPSIIFIDEIDSLLATRGEEVNETSRRVKTEFLVQLDGVATQESERILVLGATNRPYDLDEAVIRRLVKRIYIPLPDQIARDAIIKCVLKNEPHDLKAYDFCKLIRWTEGYSGSDLTALCREAAMEPIRKLGATALANLAPEDVPNLNISDFRNAIKHVRPSVSRESIDLFEDWNSEYGTHRHVDNESIQSDD
eukprot:GHVL01006051.1.p1 GENE.GHVL01006051.1~~GHVL01006051.1.p1  ORF type:complete len:207 (+),score=40.83 GHVL01006051.1:296-916(+)